ncbi:MAG: phage integrase family protein [Polaromonas sp.]|jgi:integrase|nr:phage integrase family protein [Polaromonas sp.]MDB5844136.1 phage integrase family protein [Polaromonas sp.]MDB5940415.1 phage integrase family protein [Polaromonas sp.]
MQLTLKNSVIALNPSILDGTAQSAVEDLLREGESANTLASYRSALRYWAAWHEMRFGCQIHLPVPVSSLLQFIVDHAERITEKGLASELPQAIDIALVKGGFKGKPGPLAHNTLVHRMAVMSKAHQIKNMANPCQDAKVRELLSRTRKAYAKRGVQPNKKDALTKDPLQLMLASCDDSLRGRRDRALLLFAWSSGGRRRSEIANADLKFLKRVSTGFIYTLVHSKTNQAGRDRPENDKPLLGSAAIAMADWLAASGISEGAIFRQVKKGGQLGPALAAAAVRDIVKYRSSLCGVQGNFSAHSLRSGFVTEAGRQNMPLAETMAMTGHQSVSTVLGYTRAGAALSSQVARLFDEEP